LYCLVLFGPRHSQDHTPFSEHHCSLLIGMHWVAGEEVVNQSNATKSSREGEAVVSRVVSL